MISSSLSPLRIPKPPAQHQSTATNNATGAASSPQLSPLSPRQHHRTGGGGGSEAGSSVSPARSIGGQSGGRKHNFRAVTGIPGEDNIAAQDRRELAQLQLSVQAQQNRIQTWVQQQGSTSGRNSEVGGALPYGLLINSARSACSSTTGGAAAHNNPHNHISHTPHLQSSVERQQAIIVAKQKIRDEEEQARLLKSQLLEAKVREDQLRQIEERKQQQLQRAEAERQQDAMVLERARQERERRREMSVEGHKKARSVLAEQLTQDEEKKHVDSYSKLVEKARDNKWVMENARLEKEFEAKKKSDRKEASKQDAKLWDEQIKTLEVKSPRTHLSPLARLQQQRAEDDLIIRQQDAYNHVLDGRKDFEDNVKSSKVDHQRHLIENASKVTAEVVYGPIGGVSALLPHISSPRKGGGGQSSPREVTSKPHLQQAVSKFENSPSYIVKMDDANRARKNAFKTGKVEADQHYNNAVVGKLLASRKLNRNNGVKVDVYNPEPIDSTASAFHKMGDAEDRRHYDRKQATLRLRELQELQAEEKRLLDRQAKMEERQEDISRLDAELDEVILLRRYLEDMESAVGTTTPSNNNHHTPTNNSPRTIGGDGGIETHSSPSPPNNNANNTQSWMAKRRLYKVAETGGQYKGGAPAGSRRGNGGYVNQESYHSPLKHK